MVEEVNAKYVRFEFPDLSNDLEIKEIHFDGLDAGITNGRKIMVLAPHQDDEIFRSRWDNQFTYGNDNAKQDYHYEKWGEHAIYTRKNFLNDLQTAIQEYSLTDIYVPSRYDMHFDHAYLGLFATEAIQNIQSENPSYNPTLHESIIHSCAGDSNWPIVNSDEKGILALNMPEGLETLTMFQWNERENINVPYSMRQTPFAYNLKDRALRLYTSQYYDYIGSFAKVNEIFWTRDFSSFARTATITASSQKNNSDGKEMLLGTLEYTVQEIGRRSMEKYDLELSRDAVVQYVEKSHVLHSDAVLGSITQQLNQENTLNQDVDFDKLNFLVIQLFRPGDGEKLLLFKKHISNAEAFLIDGFYYILNRDKFNSMFDYKDAFLNVVEEHTKAIVDTNMITNAQEFIDQCKNDGRYLPRLTKAILGKGFKNLAEYRSKLNRKLTKGKSESIFKGSGNRIYGAMIIRIICIREV